eukprot:TRINITY_DN4427_c0_g1_i3.p1 TRINITY_DN4427_c0_g1~~TRINITY_DN4427_c0_g1_i3.p1  ORF type:complete len:159 (+),score=47.82 TRINITY_DN4427_c0_g1_i3:126-602(+)
MQAIISGLGNASVHRLQHTFAELSKSAVQTLEESRAVMSNQSNHKTYREAFRTAAPPKVPYLGVYLTDLTFIEDGNKDEIVVKDETTGAEHLLVNFSKRKKIAAVIQEIQRNQQTPYNLLSVEQVQRLLINLEFDDERTLYNLSLEHEPRNAERESIQ